MPNIDYSNAGMAGFATDTFKEIPLFSGEAPIVTQSEVVAASALAGGDLPAFTVVGRDSAGELVRAVNGSIDPVGITCSPVLATATQRNVEIYKGGMFNPEALTWDASYADDEAKRLAFEGSAPGIFIQKIPTYGA